MGNGWFDLKRRGPRVGLLLSLVCCLAIGSLADQTDEAVVDGAEEEEAVRYLVVQDGRVDTITRGRWQKASVLVRNGKIEAVGDRIEVPEGAQVIDASGKWVLPGFVSAFSYGFGSASEKGGAVGDTLDPYDPKWGMVLSAGITTLLVAPSWKEWSGRSGKAEAGWYSVGNVLVKATWKNLGEMVLREPGVLTFLYPDEGPASRKEIRAQLLEIRNWVRAMDRYRERKASGRLEGGEEKPERPKAPKVLFQWVQGKLPGLLWSNRAEEMVPALDLVEEIGAPLFLISAAESWIIADRVGRAARGVVLDPRDKMRPDPERSGPSGANPQTPGILARAGIPVAVTPPEPEIRLGGIYGYDLLTLPLDAAFAVRGGLSREQALESITIVPARLLGVDDRVGSLEVGKDADLLILDGDPLDYRTFVEVAIVNGKIYYERAHASFFPVAGD